MNLLNLPKIKKFNSFSLFGVDVSDLKYRKLSLYSNLTNFPIKEKTGD